MEIDETFKLHEIPKDETLVYFREYNKFYTNIDLPSDYNMDLQ